jgi:Carboxypeptidase regulatory-like domain
MRFLITTLFLAAFVLPCLSAAQQPVPPPPPPTEAPAAAPPAAPAQGSSSSSGKRKSKIPPFLILGTVFNEHALAYPGVEVKIRRKGEKKFRYDTYTNSRGEFAIRVPDGIEYEVVVRQKSYKEQSQIIGANMADVQKRLTFKLESSKQAKAGDSK